MRGDFSNGPGRAGKKRNEFFNGPGRAGLGPKFKFAFRAGPGSDLNFNFFFRPGPGLSFNFFFGLGRAEIFFFTLGWAQTEKSGPCKPLAPVCNIDGLLAKTEITLYDFNVNITLEINLC